MTGLSLSPAWAARLNHVGNRLGGLMPTEESPKVSRYGRRCFLWKNVLLSA